MLTAEQKQIAQQIWQEITQAQNILLHFHRGPDGDSVGSNIAMARILKQLNKSVTIANAGLVGEHFSTYLDDPQILAGSSPCRIDLSNFDLHISLDSADISMVCPTSEQVPQPLKQLNRIVIDHHVSNTNYGQHNLVLPNVQSTCEVIFALVKFWQVDIDSLTVSALLLGLITDTGGFRWQGVGSQTLRDAADLIDLGADLEKANWAAFRNIPYNVIQLWGTFINNMEYDSRRKAVITWVDHQTIEKLGADVLKYDDTESIIASNIVDTDIGIIIKEKQPGRIGVSFRGRTGNVDVGKIATELGGGGHRLAAGCPLFDITIDQAKATILQAVDQELGRATFTLSS